MICLREDWDKEIWIDKKYCCRKASMTLSRDFGRTDVSRYMVEFRLAVIMKISSREAATKIADGA